MAAASATTAEVGAERTLGLSELTAHLVCPLCGGYYIDATAIVECLHTFCRSCILRNLRSTRRCPVAGCDVLVQRAQAASAASLRPDATLQSIVYKTVPGLHRDEMRRRQLFYADKPDAAADLPPGSKGLEEDGGAHFYDANDTVDLRIQYASQRPEDVVPVRYLRCLAGLPLSVLRKFLRKKYQLSENLRMELLHDHTMLPSDVKLLDVAYMVNWDREAPLELLFRLHKTRLPVKRSPAVLLQESSRPSKVRKLDRTDALASIGQAAKKKPASQQMQTKPTKAVTEAVASSIGERPVEKPDTKRNISNGSCGAGRSTKPTDRDLREKSGSTKPAKAVTEAVASAIGERPVEKADTKRNISNGSCGAGRSTKPPDHDVREKSDSVGITSNQKSRGESAKMALSMRDGVKAAKGSPTVLIERIDKKRKARAIDTTRTDTDKNTVLTSKPSKVSKTALSVSEQKQKSSAKPQPGSSTSIQRDNSMPVLSVDDVCSSGKVDRCPGAVIDSSPKHTGNKAKSSLNDPSQLVDQQKNHSTTSTSRERMGQEHKMAVKQTSAASHDSNANRLKHTEKGHRQRDLEKKIPEHQGLGTKGQTVKATDAAKPVHKQPAYHKKTNDTDTQTSFQSTKEEICSGTTFKNPTTPVSRPSSAKMSTMPLQSVKTKQNQGKSPKTTSHGTNTFLSSSPQITKAQTTSSTSPVHKTFKHTATSLYSSHGESPSPRADKSKEHLSERCSPNLQKTTSTPDVQRSASKTIFFFSGSKKPQNSTKIMSIVESLTQKSLMSSLAKQGSTVTHTNQPAKQSSVANSTLRSNPPAASKTPAVSKTPSASTNGTFVVPSPVPARSAAASPGCPVSSPLHIETASLGLRYSSAVPPLSGLSRPAPSSTTSSSSSSRPVFPVLPLPQRPKSQSVRSIPNPSLVRQRSADERARDCGKGSPTAGSTAPAMSSPTISDIHSLTRQLHEAGTSVTITNTT